MSSSSRNRDSKSRATVCEELLTTDLVILNHRQEIRTKSEMAPVSSIFCTAEVGRHFSLDIFKGPRSRLPNGLQWY
ncbi:hypothetical protein TNCV_1866131 [Trichonephila clavipes]|nr:hypothetical protein TNCV_1866131 [Trichonephila clavipes]